MIDWLRRLLGRAEPAPAFDAPLRHPRREDEVSAVEAALTGLLAAGIRLGPHLRDLSLREVARGMAEHPEFAVGDEADGDLTLQAPNALAIDILWSYRSLADGIEDEFANATMFSDHCYDGAEPETYTDLFRRLVTLGAWTCRDVTATPVPDLGPYGHGFRIAFAAEPPIPPVTFPADKDFDWALLAPLNASLPAAEPRRLWVAADGGTALVVFLTDAEARGVETCLGFGPGALGAPA
ncbi:hypothetical protein [Methylobacterium sp. Leaf118]|uniref:hypothetical protein n=1 Tax=Methylobacterium sp. Leaf118 TaxID=2876562 RepID=UPI001E56DFE9|nr:hypothetical protein [Methylobacterium sp. Leaf118]